MRGGYIEGEEYGGGEGEVFVNKEYPPRQEALPYTATSAPYSSGGESHSVSDLWFILL